MSNEDKHLLIVATTINSLHEIYSTILRTGRVSDLINSRKDLKEMHNMLDESLDELHQIVALKKLLHINNISEN